MVDAAKSAPPSMEEDIAMRLAYMDSNNISQAMLMPANGYSAPDGIEATRRANNYVAKYRDQMNNPGSRERKTVI